MKTNVLKKWVRALRSGKYKQSTNHLRLSYNEEVPTYCCLGVLCDLHAKETGRDWDGNEYLGRSGTLPEDVQRWAGLMTDDPVLISKPKKGKVEATECNDDYKMKFKTIANLIVKAQKQKLI